MTSTTAAPFQVQLGIFDGYMSRKRDRLTSETKIGGTPTYFPTLSETQQTQLRRWTSCGVCGHAMSLLAQAYSPLPTAPADMPHHRMLYVFACNSSYCARQPSSSMVAFSLQVDQEDEQALAEDTEQAEGGDEDEVIETGPLLPAELPDAVLPPCYVYIEAEPTKEVVVPTDIERELIKMAEENAHSTVSDEELQQLEQTVDLKDKRTDYFYEKFRARVARAPSQVLRYYERRAGPSPARAKEVKPIFMNPDKVKAMVTVPACACCNAAQTAELQVMPTALYYLHVNQYTALARAEAGLSTTPAAAAATAKVSPDAAATQKTSSGGNVDDGCDFGTVTVYVCAKDCAARQRGVALRRETLCVEEAPSMRDEERAEKADAAQSVADAAARKVTLRELLHGDGAAVVGDSGAEEEEEEGEQDVDAPATAA